MPAICGAVGLRASLIVVARREAPPQSRPCPSGVTGFDLLEAFAASGNSWADLRRTNAPRAKSLAVIAARDRRRSHRATRSETRSCHDRSAHAARISRRV